MNYSYRGDDAFVGSNISDDGANDMSYDGDEEKASKEMGRIVKEGDFYWKAGEVVTVKMNNKRQLSFGKDNCGVFGEPFDVPKELVSSLYPAIALSTDGIQQYEVV